jgi:hypothetical protein
MKVVNSLFNQRVHVFVSFKLVNIVQVLKIHSDHHYYYVINLDLFLPHFMFLLSSLPASCWIYKMVYILPYPPCDLFAVWELHVVFLLVVTLLTYIQSPMFLSFFLPFEDYKICSVLKLLTKHLFSHPILLLSSS